MKNGFTLIELMGVLLILGIIASVIFVAIESNIKSSRQKTCLAQEKNIIEGAKMYFIDYPSETTVTIEILKQNGYIDDNLKNPMTNQLYNGNTTVSKNNYLITYNEKNFF